MTTNISHKGAPVIKPSTDGSVYALHLVHGTPWNGAKVMGFPCNGLDVMAMGVLPERLKESAATATYVIRHHETPIAWRLPSGNWRVPMIAADETPIENVAKKKIANYSVTTATFRSNIIGALKSQGIIPDES